MIAEVTWDLRDLGVQIIALPSREQVTMLSWLNLGMSECKQQMKEANKQKSFITQNAWLKRKEIWVRLQVITDQEFLNFGILSSVTKSDVEDLDATAQPLHMKE